ncbi:MAG: RNA polymerase sigma factor [Planctomycetota bacterium]
MNGCISYQAARRLAALAARSGAHGFSLAQWMGMDADTLSGCVLELFHTTGHSFCFEIFYELNHVRIIRLVSRSPAAYAWSFNHGEMAGDILFDIYRFAGTFHFRNGRSFRAWVSVVARNRMRKAVKHFRNRPKSLSYGSGEISDRKASNPLDRILARETRQQQRAILWLLLCGCMAGIHKTSIEEKEILRLHEGEGLPFREITARSPRSMADVARINRRARRKVAKFLKDCLSQAGVRQALIPEPSSRVRRLG